MSDPKYGPKIKPGEKIGGPIVVQVRGPITVKSTTPNVVIKRKD